MLHNEFEELIGRKATEQEYIEANAMYMEAGDVDKFDFCEEWLYLKGSKVAKALYEKIRTLQEWQHKGLPMKRWAKFLNESLVESESLDESTVQRVDFWTMAGQWARIEVEEQAFEYMEDEDDEETYVSGGFVTDGTNLIIDYDGVYELPALVKRAFEILSYDLSEL